MATYRTIDGKKLRADKNNRTEYTYVADIAEGLLDGYKGKTILEIGCGDDLVSWDHSPNLGREAKRRGAIVYGLDPRLKKYEGKGICSVWGNNSEDRIDLKEFEKRTGVIPVIGNIEDIIDLFKKNQFDAIVSKSVIGQPTYGLNWDIEFKKLFDVTRAGGFQVHYKYAQEDFEFNKAGLERIGFQVLNYFDEDEALRRRESCLPDTLFYWRSSLILKKPDKK